MTDRRLVELVDIDGRAVGACPVGEAHTPPGRLHRAFSVLLFDADGRVLMQQRALTKSRFAGRWTNTCCSHPGPGEDVTTSALRRLDEELGLQVDWLREVGRFVYRAADPHSGLVEHEYDHLFVGHFDGAPAPDPLLLAAGLEWPGKNPLRGRAARLELYGWGILRLVA